MIADFLCGGLVGEFSPPKKQKKLRNMFAVLLSVTLVNALGLRSCIRLKSGLPAFRFIHTCTHSTGK